MRGVALLTYRVICWQRGRHDNVLCVVWGYTCWLAA
jgi:hypothetical protein